MLDSEESDENVDDNDGTTSSSSRLASGTLQPIDRTHARRLLLQMLLCKFAPISFCYLM